MGWLLLLITGMDFKAYMGKTKPSTCPLEITQLLNSLSLVAVDLVVTLNLRYIFLCGNRANP